ncbi:alpha,alpha-trehalose-phosphate synthase (UDP-forming) [Arsenicicoccus dermatophilus]|uniref:alpha,alpha-trehalose-phosphate synthase (UDP-forming) n=1 Tax=Arsenicicoccus dermatophilus TaxID=1076331 RepID=UPI001F4D069D|nr:trehalose-6-phosphate synthase [Arsenicicoccus dermatophilus]MCH8612004.1 trehalose-6-phosphate synthase [Arsenicicoccus dermatophilus]
MADSTQRFDFVIAANRLPVDRVVDADGNVEWHRSPGGLVTAMESVMSERDGVWVGWAGEAGEAPAPFDEGGMRLHPVPLSEEEVAGYYEGFSNDTLWPIYHDVIVPAQFHRKWWQLYREVNERFAQALADVAAEGATVWVHDYQLQLVPALLRQLRSDVRIGWFDHIPFPPVELFGQLPWRAAILEGLLGADFLGFQRPGDAENFLRACRRHLGMTVKGDVVHVGKTTGGHDVRAASVPISVDFSSMDELARRPEVRRRAKEIRASLGDPSVLLLGIDRLDYTKGIRHRLKAYEELLRDGHLDGSDTTFVQIATPSRERIDAYIDLREHVESAVGRINGEYSDIGSPAMEYLHQSHPREELAALYLAADIMLVTPLRDGMNLVAKEYVSCRHDNGGALVLSEFTGAAEELKEAYLVNPHDTVGLKRTIMDAIGASPAERSRRMKALRRRVRRNDVQHWAASFLEQLEAAPGRPARHTRPATLEREEREGRVDALEHQRQLDAQEDEAHATDEEA